MPGFVEGIYVAHGAGEPMERVGQVTVLKAAGLQATAIAKAQGTGLASAGCARSP